MNHVSPQTTASQPPVVCLLGPTASGKTAAALALAERFPLEIISLDSALVYRQMDIGTAKPSPEELERVPHHLINIIDPSERYSAAQFVEDANRLMNEIRARGRMPLIAGGTMLYYKALAQGLNDLPQADASIRAEIDADAAIRGWPALHAELAVVDPVTAARLPASDAQRIQRALEVFRIMGKPMSSLLSRAPTTGSSTFAGPLNDEMVVIALEPSDRSVLHTRIEQRFDAMLEAGLLDEVIALRARGDLHLALPSMRCVGYRQVWEFLDGESDAPTMRERGIAATRQLCKRQLTWLRSTPERISIDCLAPDYIEKIAEVVARAHG
jgi:tRNA dimethylallyltransferase